MLRLTETEFARIAKALSDPQRCEILQRTAEAGELSCSSIGTQCPVSLATISHHLKELSAAGLLDRRREGQFAFYSFRPEVMAAYIAELSRRMGVSLGARRPVRHERAPVAAAAGEPARR